MKPTVNGPDDTDRSPETGQPVLRLLMESTPQMFGPPRVETWAVAVLDDGTEIRMRHLGDRVEVRGWDPEGNCRPPALRADVLGRYEHIVDVSPTDPEVSIPPGGSR